MSSVNCWSSDATEGSFHWTAEIESFISGDESQTVEEASTTEDTVRRANLNKASPAATNQRPSNRTLNSGIMTIPAQADHTAAIRSHVHVITSSTVKMESIAPCSFPKATKARLVCPSLQPRFSAAHLSRSKMKPRQGPSFQMKLRCRPQSDHVNAPTTTTTTTKPPSSRAHTIAAAQSAVIPSIMPEDEDSTMIMMMSWEQPVHRERRPNHHPHGIEPVPYHVLASGSMIDVDKDTDPWTDFMSPTNSFDDDDDADDDEDDTSGITEPGSVLFTIGKGQNHMIDQLMDPILLDEPNLETDSEDCSLLLLDSSSLCNEMEKVDTKREAVSMSSRRVGLPPLKKRHQKVPRRLQSYENLPALVNEKNTTLKKRKVNATITTATRTIQKKARKSDTEVVGVGSVQMKAIYRMVIYLEETLEAQATSHERTMCLADKSGDSQEKNRNKSASHVVANEQNGTLEADTSDLLKTLISAIQECTTHHEDGYAKYTHLPGAIFEYLVATWGGAKFGRIYKASQAFQHPRIEDMYRSRDGHQDHVGPPHPVSMLSDPFADESSDSHEVNKNAEPEKEASKATDTDHPSLLQVSVGYGFHLARMRLLGLWPLSFGGQHSNDTSPAEFSMKQILKDGAAMVKSMSKHERLLFWKYMMESPIQGQSQPPPSVQPQPPRMW